MELKVDQLAPLGARHWAIAEGFIPEDSTGPAPQMTSHETACILNSGPEPAHVQVLIYFADRSPMGPFELEIPSQRTLHMRFNELGEGAIPRGRDFASVFVSDVPVVVQHTRLDSRQAANALLSTVAYGSD